jgi:hypothetical protein
MVFPAIQSFFVTLRGPDPTDVDDIDVPTKVQELLDTNAAHQSRISALEHEVARLKKWLRVREQAMQKDIAETLALGDTLVKRDVSAAAEKSEWKAGVKKETWSWQTKFAEKARKEVEGKCADNHANQIKKMVKEKYEPLTLERDSAVQAKDKAEHELALLKQDLANEHSLHLVAITITQKLQSDLDKCRENYQVLHDDYDFLDENYAILDGNYIALHEEWVQKTEALTQSEKVYAELCNTHDAVLEKKFQVEMDYVDAAHNSKQAYKMLDDAYSAFNHLKEELDTSKTAVDRTVEMVRTAKVGVKALKRECNKLLQQEKTLSESLARAVAERDTTLDKLVTALKQREEALKGEVGALKVVERMKKGEVMDDGKEIVVLDEGVDEDEDAASEAQGESGASTDNSQAAQKSRDISSQSEEHEYLEEQVDLSIDGEEEGDEYDDCGEDERQADAEYEDISEGDLNEVEGMLA